MPRPAAWIMVPVRASYAELFDDLPPSASVLFTTDQVVVCAGVTVFGGRSLVPLDSEFKLSTSLPASDDPGLNITPVTYHVREMWRGGRQFDITVPASAMGTGIDLSTIAPVADPVVGGEYKPGPQGPAGTLAIGTVTTGAPGSAAAVVNVGTPEAAVLDITLPAGVDGPPGSIQSIAGLSAADIPATALKTALELDAVDNTSDANKPVSDATAAAIADTNSAVSDMQTQVDARLVAAANLSDLDDAPTARTNLGLGDLATMGAGNVTEPVVVNGTLTTKVAPNTDSFCWMDNAGNVLWRGNWDTGNFHQYLNGHSLLWNMAGGSFKISGNGISSQFYLVNGAAFWFDSPSDSIPAMRLGSGAYASASNTLTRIALWIVQTWAWNGTNGYSVSSVCKLRARQRSTNANDMVLELLGGAALAPQLSIDPQNGDIDTNGIVSTGVFTVDMLPLAATAGAGAHAYVSDGRKAGEAAGAGTGIPVWCDGTNWRTYYDNSIVAA